MNPNLEKKLLLIKRDMLSDIKDSWDKVIDLGTSDRKIYYHEATVDTILKYYKMLFDEDLCKETKSENPILDIERVNERYKEIIEEIRNIGG